jgi:hypothetical protein
VHPSVTIAKSPEVATLLIVSPTEFGFVSLAVLVGLVPPTWGVGEREARREVERRLEAGTAEVNRLWAVRTTRRNSRGARVVSNAGGGESQPDLA